MEDKDNIIIIVIFIKWLKGKVNLCKQSVVMIPYFPSYYNYMIN